MRFHLKDLFATFLMGAIAVPYIGYLVRGEMPPIEDARGMTSTAWCSPPSRSWSCGAATRSTGPARQRQPWP